MTILNYPKPETTEENMNMSASQTIQSVESELEQPRVKGKVNLSRTISKLQTASDAPIAVGRSGLRADKGIAASGLLGERYNTSDNPSTNSFSQRSWLPYDDPSLTFKKNGVPVAETKAFGSSLPIGEAMSEREKMNGKYGRTACISRPSKTSIFGDEY